MERDINSYADCDVFKPGERWRSRRGTHYFVLGVEVGGRATLRTLSAPWAGPNPVSTDPLGRIRMVPWDGVMGWVRYSAASATSNPKDPPTNQSQ